MFELVFVFVFFVSVLSYERFLKKKKNLATNANGNAEACKCDPNGTASGFKPRSECFIYLFISKVLSNSQYIFFSQDVLTQAIGQLSTGNLPPPDTTVPIVIAPTSSSSPSSSSSSSTTAPITTAPALPKSEEEKKLQ
jgi:hypothetical protein